jgi:hypothetical protein
LIAKAVIACSTITNFCCANAKNSPNEPIIPPPLVRGDDLIALGFKPGPEFGQILEAVETRQLEGRLRTADEALEWVKATIFVGQAELRKRQLPNAE